MIDRLSAVVVTYNSAATIDRCLKSLEMAGVSEVLVIDNNSTDCTSSIVGLYTSRLDEFGFFEARTNLGFGRAVNRGVAMLRNETNNILLVNPDCFVDPTQVVQGAALVPIHAEILGFTQVNEELATVPVLGPLPTLIVFSGIAIRVIFGRHTSTRIESHLERFLDLRPKQELVAEASELHVVSKRHFVTASLMIINRSAFRTLRGFDEAYFMYCEDADLVERAHRRGLRVRLLNSDSKSIHLVGGSGGGQLYDSPAILASFSIYLRRHRPCSWLASSAIALSLAVGAQFSRSLATRKAGREAIRYLVTRQP